MPVHPAQPARPTASVGLDGTFFDQSREPVALRPIGYLWHPRPDLGRSEPRLGNVLAGGRELKFYRPFIGHYTSFQALSATYRPPEAHLSATLSRQSIEMIALVNPVPLDVDPHTSACLLMGACVLLPPARQCPFIGR